MFSKAELYCQDVVNVASSELPWNKLKNKTLLLTGASGLIGTFLIDVLMRKNETDQLGIKIYAVGRNENAAQKRFADYWDSDCFSFLKLDVNQPIDSDIHFDYILHAASNTHPVQYATDPVNSLMTNLLGTYNLLEYGRKCSLERFIFLSSVEIYGQALREDDVFDESYCGYIDCNTVRAGYPEGKRAGEALCQAYIAKYGMDIVIPRLSRVYGPTMKLDDSKAMSQFLMNGVRGEDIVLKSEGLQKFSYCYVADVVLGILFVWLKGKIGEAYNVTDVKTDMLLRDITQYIAELNGRKVIFQLPEDAENKGFSKVTVGVMTPAKLQKLGWKPFDDLKSGIGKTIKILKLQRL
jgi:nucleoside-diphosphate-sugar epimerase